MRRTVKLSLLALCLIVGTESSAADDFFQGDLVRKRTLKRARRVVAVGPTIGGSLLIGDGDVGGAVSMGLGLYLFDVAVAPRVSTMSEALQGTAKREALARAKHLIATGEAPAGMNAEDLAVAIIEEVRTELVRQLLADGRKFEKPRFTVDVEGGYQFAAEAWHFRTSATMGLGPVSLGPTFHVSEAGVGLGPELALRLLGNRGPRPPVLGLFIRADFALSDRETNVDMYSFGARALLDLL
ncbi:MAG: hypothetical protein IPL79_10880 [Myxococcales bacterium]|nr:hypothetical protein [Myxococcales bacterium]